MIKRIYGKGMLGFRLDIYAWGMLGVCWVYVEGISIYFNLKSKRVLKRMQQSVMYFRLSYH